MSHGIRYDTNILVKIIDELTDADRDAEVDIQRTILEEEGALILDVEVFDETFASQVHYVGKISYRRKLST